MCVRRAPAILQCCGDSYTRQPPAPEQVVVKEVAEWLRNGMALSEFVGTTVQKIKDSGLPFKQIENLTLFVDAARAIGLSEISTSTMSDMQQAEHETHQRMFQVESPNDHGIKISATTNQWTMQVECLEGHNITRSKLAEIGRGGYSTLQRTVPAPEDRNVTEPKRTEFDGAKVSTPEYAAPAPEDSDITFAFRDPQSQEKFPWRAIRFVQEITTCAKVGTEANPDGEQLISRTCDVVLELSEWFDQARQEEASQQCIAAFGSFSHSARNASRCLSPTSANGWSVRFSPSRPSCKSSWCFCPGGGAAQMFATPCDKRAWTSRTWRRSLLRRRVGSHTLLLMNASEKLLWSASVSGLRVVLACRFCSLISSLDTWLMIRFFSFFLSIVCSFFVFFVCIHSYSFLFVAILTFVLLTVFLRFSCFFLVFSVFSQTNIFQCF